MKSTPPISQPPISTVGAPTTIGAPHNDMSPIRAAGITPISTVGQPGGGNEQMCGVPTVAAGMPAINTVGTPGGAMTPG
jgi:hypothetical protein